MHPARRAIFSTTSSGLGYGLFFLLGIMGPTGLLQPARGFGIAVFATAFASAAAGLATLAPHPLRSQAVWRTRARIIAAVSCLPAAAFALGWIWPATAGGLWAPAGLLSALGAALTATATAKVHAGLPARAERWAVPAFLLLALTTGSLWLAFLSRAFAVDWPAVTHLPIALLIVAWFTKVQYWARIDLAPSDPAEPVAQPPVTGQRRAAQALAFFIPLVLTQLTMFLSAGAFLWANILALVAALAGTAGVVLERHLFFAETASSDHGDG